MSPTKVRVSVLDDIIFIYLYIYIYICNLFLSFIGSHKSIHLLVLISILRNSCFPETRRLLQKQFGSDNVDGEDDSATVVTTSSLMVSLPAIVIDHRIMIPCNEPDWATIVMDYMNLLLNLVHATEPDDASFISRVSLRLEKDCTDQNDEMGQDVIDDDELQDDELDEYDLSLHIETSNQDGSGEEHSERYGDYYVMEQYYKETSTSNRDLMGNNNISSHTTNSGTTTNDSAESSVTQVTTNLTRRSTSSSRLPSLLDVPFQNSSNDVSTLQEESCSNHKNKKAATDIPSINIIPPTPTIQFPSHDDADLCDHTSFSTLSYTISNEVQRVKAVQVERTAPFPMAVCSTNKVPEIPQVKEEASKAATRIVGTVHHQPGQRMLTVPHTKQTITVADLTRQLMNETTHRYQYIPQSSSTKWQNAFRGFEGILIWKNLFGTPNTNSTMKHKGKSPDTGDDDKWIEFGLLLLSYGILHDYTPNETDFRRAYLAVQPLRNTFSMNTLLQWVPLKHENNGTLNGDTGPTSKDDNALSTVLRLSRSIDAIVERYTANPTSSHHLLDEYEESVCQLQVTPLPVDPTTKMVVALNLYNMIVRHALLLTLSKKRKGWTWPNSLEEMDLLLDKIGYMIDGTFMSASRLREYLFCGVDRLDYKEYTTGRKIVSPRNGSRPGNSCMSGRRSVIGTGSNRVVATMAGASCMGGGATNRWKKGLVDESDYYEGRRVVTDKRLLMALTWGTSNSPAVGTVYPDQFDKTLDLYAERYCQKYVTLTENTLSSSGKTVTVTLPTLFSWYRSDFGTYRENVLESMKQYLSAEVRDKIIEAPRSGKLRITFDVTSTLNWMCRMPETYDLKVEGGCRHQTVLHPTKALAPSHESLHNVPQKSVARPKKVVDSSLVNKENTLYSKEVDFSKEKAINSIQSMSSVKEITPGKPMYKKPSPFIPDTFGSSKNTNEANLTISQDDGTTSSALNPDIYLAHLKVTRNILGEMGVDHLLCPSQDKASHQVSSLLSPTRSETASHDIVISGLNHRYHSSTDIPAKHKHTNHKHKEGSSKVHLKNAVRPTPAPAQHDIQTGLFPDGHRNSIHKRSTHDIADQIFGQAPHEGSDRLALIQQWIGFTEREPTSARQASQGDSILMQAVQAPPSARQTSLGDSILLPPLGRTKILPRTSAPNPDTTKIQYFLPTENRDPNILYDANRRFDDNEAGGGQSFTFRSDVSAITFGSEFDALLRANSLQQLIHPTTQLPPASMHHIRNMVPHPATLISSSTPTGPYPQLQQQ